MSQLQDVTDAWSSLSLSARESGPASRLLTSLVRFVRSKPLGAFGAALALLFTFVAVFAPWLVTHDPLSTSGDYLQAPSAAHFFGTDNLGRDVFSRMVEGSRVSIAVGLASVFFSTLMGSLVGVFSGYWGGKTDSVLMRAMDMVMAFPSLILALAIMAMLAPSATNVVIAIAITQTPSIARVVRAHTLTVTASQFIEAARSTGANDGRILRYYIAPNVLSTIIVYASTNIGYAILTEGTLSFLGMGIPPPAPSWGEMLSGQARLFFVSAPWLALFPIGALTFAILGTVLLGDALRDVLDPRLRGTS